MLEILLILSLCRSVGGRLEDKGYPSASSYQFFVIIAWFGGQFVGAFAAAFGCAVLDHGREHLGLVNLGFLFGSSLAIGIVVWFASALPDDFRSGRAAELEAAAVLADLHNDGDNPYRMPNFFGHR